MFIIKGGETYNQTYFKSFSLFGKSTSESHSLWS